MNALDDAAYPWEARDPKEAATARRRSGAAPTANSYDYLAGAGNRVVPLCNFGGCPAVARSAGGDEIEIKGAGTFTVAPAEVTGGGEYTWRNPAGQVVETGTWNASRLLRFQSFGLGSRTHARTCEASLIQ